MRVPKFNTLKTKNSLILISVILPLLIAYLTYDVSQQSEKLRQSLMDRGVILSKTGVATTSKLLGDAIKNGHLTEAQLFDRSYQMIQGTSPPKYHTKYDAYTDQNFRQVQDAFLQDPVVVYAVAVDINGYVPTHNTKFDQKGKGLEFDRSKRLFDDPVGNRANRNVKPYLLQEYQRDTGETLWDISTPIYLNGRHWGAFRLALSIEETNKLIAANMKTSILAGFVLTIALLFLAIYISNRIAIPVKLLEEGVQRVAEGDWSLIQPGGETKDELGSLMRSFGNMVIRMRDLAGKTHNTTRLIATYTRDLLLHSENAAGAADAVTDKLEMVAENMQNLEDGTAKIVLTTNQASDNLSEAERSSEKFVYSMEKSKNAMFVAHDVIKELESQVDKVGAVIQYISILADQSGQLAQKAVKEANRVCEKDSDFSALALEIQSRASSAAESSKEVSDLFRTVQNQAKQASSALEEHRNVILSGISVARSSYKSLKTIITDLQELTHLTRAVLDNSKLLVDGVQSIHLDVEAQTALVKRFTEAAGVLEEVVEELQETVNTIKV